MTSWCDFRGFCFLLRKPVMFFHRKSKWHWASAADPIWFTHQHRVPGKILGMVIDDHLMYLLHVIDLKVSCHLSLDLLCYLTTITWGADCKTLLWLYMTIVCSKVDNDGFIYGQIPRSSLHLSTIQNEGLYIATGVSRSNSFVLMERRTYVLPVHPPSDPFALSSNSYSQGSAFVSRLLALCIGGDLRILLSSNFFRCSLTIRI